ncbi:LppX_LprAFG lipoprotein [Nocardioides pacificus]
MRRTTLVRRAAIAAATPLLLVTLTSCGSDDADDTANTSASTSESDGAGAAPVADVAEGEEVDPAEFADEIASGLDDVTTAHLTMTMEGGTMEMTAEGDVDYTETPPAMAMTMSNSAMGEEEMDIRLVDGTIYASVPGMTNGKFIALDSDDPNNPMGQLFTEQLDPRKTMEGLTEGIEKVVFVGEEDVDGESLRHYTMTLDPEALKELGGDMMGQMGTGQPKVDLPEEMTYDIWLDDESRTRVTEMDLGEANGSVTVEMDAWGEPVSIEAPPEDEIVEMGSSPAA